MRAPAKATVRFLPVLVLVLLAVLPAHIGSLWTGIAKLAMAQDAANGGQAAGAPAPGPGSASPADAAAASPPAAPTRVPASAAAADAPTALAAAVPADATAAAGKPDAAGAASFDTLTLTKSEVEILQQLAKRRDELDQRERALKDREALLAATEQRINDEIQKMQQLKAAYEQLQTQRSDAEEASLRRLVAVYEAMKPEEAARIFETMEGSVLLDVVTRMGERRLAPILAQMTPARAQALTVAMANRRVAAAPSGS
jgi:flagellar motility protein MotE (MotC chaperone)